MRHVLHVTRDFPPRVHGGLSIMVDRIVAAMAPHEHATVVSFDGWRPNARLSVDMERPEVENVRDGLRVIRIHSPSQLEPLGELLRKVDADLVNLHDALLLQEALKWPVVQNQPVLFTVHVLHAEQNRLREVSSTASGDAEAKAMALADRVHVLSASCADVLLEHYPETSRRLRLAPPGGDVPPAHGAAAHSPAAGQDAATPANRADAPVAEVLFAGRFSDLKGLDQLLAAFARVHRIRPDTSLRIAGGLPDNSRAERRVQARLQGLLPEGAARAVSWDGWLDSKSLAVRMCSATVITSPSRFETFGQTAIEALLLEKPLVARPTGRLADLAPRLHDRAILVRGETEELADALLLSLDRQNPPSPLPEDLERQLRWHANLPDWLALHEDAVRLPE